MTEQAYSIDGDELTQRALLAKMRHDLRTPINAIIGYSELLLEDAGEQQAYFVPDLEKVHAAGMQLLEIVNTILNPAKIEEATEISAVDVQEMGAELSHAVLTPVSAVLGYGELLLEDAVASGNDAFARDLERICKAAQRFLVHVGDLVHFRQVAQGASQPIANLATTDASAMIAGVVTTIRSANRAAVEWSHYGPILVVDDSETNRDVLSHRLRRTGLRVETATNGREALDILWTQPFDLVLLDIMMPEMNGLEVLERMKADASLREIPVVMISALDETDSVVRCLEMGAEDYLPKPFNPVVLHARIGVCLEKKRLRDLEIEYLRNVAAVTSAAGAVERGQFDSNSLSAVASRDDELGQLARVFQRMAHEVAAREQRLKQQVEELRIEIDEVKKQQQVADITESDAFRDVLERARRFRAES